MAGYGSIPSDGNASTQVSDSGTYLAGSERNRLGAADIGIIVGVSVFFALVIVVIFAWQVHSLRRKRRAATAAADDDGEDRGAGRAGADSPAPTVATERIELKAMMDDNMSRLPAGGAGPFSPGRRRGADDPPRPALPTHHRKPEARFSAVSRHASEGSFPTMGSLLKSLREGKPKEKKPRADKGEDTEDVV